MSSYTFSLVLDGIDITNDSVLDSLYEAGLDDATFGIAAGVPYASVQREASSFSAAIMSALHDAENAGLGLRVVRVEPDELVNAADIARRVQRSRESVRLLAEGKRGPGDFPAPALLLHGSQPVWHWSEVAQWFHEYAGLDGVELAHAEFIAAINGALEVRRHAPNLGMTEERGAVADLLSSVV